MSEPASPQDELNRHELLQAAAGTAGVLARRVRCDSAEGQPATLQGNIKHSIVQWCFADYWNLDELCRESAAVGLPER